MRTFGYLLLLAIAFVVGLVGTVAASHALVGDVTEPPAVHAVDNDANLPSRIPAADDLFTVEC